MILVVGKEFTKEYMKNLIQIILSIALCIGFTVSHASDLNLILKYDIADERNGDTREQIGTAVLEYKITRGLYIKGGYGYTRLETPFGTAEANGYIAGVEMIIPIGN